jgi:hypothetical protein
VRHILLIPFTQDLVSFVFIYGMPQELIQVMSSLPHISNPRKDGFERKKSLSDQDCVFTSTDRSGVSSADGRFDYNNTNTDSRGIGEV